MYNVFSDNASLARLLRNRVFIVCMILVFAAALWISYTICGAKIIEIIDGTITKQIFTHHSDPHEIVKQANFSLKPGDQIFLSHSSDHSAALVVDRAHDVTVSYGGIVSTVRLTGRSTVAQAVQQAGFEPDSDDIFSISPESSLDGVTEITIDQVAYVTYTTTETSTFETIRTESADLSKGKTKVKTRGVEGTTLLTYRDTLINGEVTETTLINSEIVTDAVNEEILVGIGSQTKSKSASTKSSKEAVKTSASVSGAVSSLTPSAPIALDASGRPVQYKQLITGKATAYTSSEGSLTATGRTVRTGLVAVNPKQIPYGSHLYIITEDGSIVYGYAIAADTGGFASKGRITVDLFFASREECREFGVRNVEIYVLS